MFIADKFVYLELQKTGGSHLLRLFDLYTDGHISGKHNCISQKYLDRNIVGSIRNPWDWYVSLWGFGVDCKGAIRSRLCRNVDFGYYYRDLPRNMGKKSLVLKEWLLSIYHDLYKPVALWQSLYQDVDNPELFRNWLRLLLDFQRRYDVGEGYGFSPLSRTAGLMTYRYLRLYAAKWNDMKLYRDKRLSSNEGIAEFDRENNFTDYMIKSESLEQDFISMLVACGYVLDSGQRQIILDKQSDKTNVSSRHPVEYYYDQETIDLVAKRDRFLIEKYHYTPPALKPVQEGGS